MINTKLMDSHHLNFIHNLVIGVLINAINFRQFFYLLKQLPNVNIFFLKVYFK